MAKKKTNKASNRLPEFISEKEQEAFYSQYYYASKELISAEDKQVLRNYFNKADTLHLENNCKETFIQWVVSLLNKAYSAKPDLFKQALVHLFHFGLNFNLPSREGCVILIDIIKLNYLTATKIVIDTLNAKIISYDVFDIVNDRHPLFIAWRHPDKTMFDLILDRLDRLTDRRDTPMTLAARYGDVDALNYIHRKGFSIEERDAHSMTPLMHAFMNGHNACVLQLIELGADLFAKNMYGETAFHLAFKCHQTDELFDNRKFSALLSQLPSRYADLFDINGFHPIHLAIKANATRWVKRFLNDNPSLLHHTDKSGFSLAYHALHSSRLALLQYFHDDLHLALGLERGFPLFDYALDKQDLPIATYLHSINQAPLYPTEERPTAPLFRALEQKNPTMLAWLLTLIDLDNDHFIENYKTSSNNLAFFLVEYNQMQSLIAFDLFGKNIQQLLYKNASGMTCLDRFQQLMTAKEPTAWDELDQQFFRYVVSSLNQHAESEPNFSAFSYFDSFYPLLERALLHDPSLINQRLLNEKPCLHLVENYFHLKHLHPDGLDESAYQLAMKHFKKTHHIKSELLNAKNPHLFLDIIQSNRNVTARIRALHGMGGFSLSSLDKDNLSLLDHACQRADRDLLDWCYELMPASELRLTSKRRSYLEHALMTKDHAFCEHLFRNKLSTEQIIAYFKTIKRDDDSMKQLIAFQFFGLNENCDRQSQFKQMASWTNPLFKQYLVVKPQALNKASPVESSVMFKAPITSELTLSAVEKAITANQVHKIKLFKTLPYNNALEEILREHTESILTLCMRENNYTKMQSKQKHRHADDQEMHVNMMNELMDIAPVHDWIVAHGHQAITMAIDSQSIGALSLCLGALDENTSREILSAHGFNYALLALESVNPSMLRMILEHKTIMEQVILHQNELLMASLIKNKTNHALLLLRMPQLSCFAHINDNQALCHASGLIELSSVALTLLELPEVAQNAAVANNVIFYNAKQNKDDDLMHALIHLPCVKETLPEAEHDAVIAHATDAEKASMAYEHSQENVVPIYYVPIYYAPIPQQPRPFINPELAILFNDVANLDYFLSAGVCVNTMKYLIMYSLQCGKPGLVKYLFHGRADQNLIESDPDFCHDLMHMALLYFCYPVIDMGFDIDTRHPFLHLRKNQLLALCLDMGLLRSAHRLLACPRVIEEAPVLNNRILRHACRYNQVSMVNELLRIDAVRNNLHVFDHAPFREAALRGHPEVVKRLLEEPEVRDYVNRDQALYPGIMPNNLNTYGALPQAEYHADYGRAQTLFGAMGHNPAHHQSVHIVPSTNWNSP